MENQLTEKAGKSSPGDAAGVDAGPVEGHSPGACGRAVIVADERHGGGKIESFAEAAESTAKGKLRVAVQR